MMFDRPVPQGVLPQVADLLGAPLDRLTAQHLRDAVAAGVGETVHLDFKRDPYAWRHDNAKAKAKARREIVKDVAALANTEGGVVVIGVREEEGRAVEAMPVDLGEGFGQWARQQLAGMVHPHLGEVSIGRLEDVAGRGFILIVVPPGPLRPYGAQPTVDEPLRYYHRVGTDNRLMAEAEVRRAYARGHARADDRRHSISGSLFDGLDLDRRGWALVTVVPFAPGRFPVTSTNLAAVNGRERLDTRLARAGSPQPARVVVGGFVRRYDGDDVLVAGGSVDYRAAVVEHLRDDGSFACAWSLFYGADERREFREGSPKAINERGPKIEQVHLTIDRLLGTLVGALRSGFAHVRAAGGYGFAHVSVTLAAGGPKPPGVIADSQPDGVEVHGPGPSGWTYEVAPVPGEPVTVPVAIVAPEDDRGVLSAARDAAAPLMQRFGVPELATITPAGEIAAAFADQNTWARTVGLPVEGTD